ncbi:hypothetical protein ACFUIT_02440 [Streptomyces sp. NPDC057239]|uniref:hypothetical protein n=1 Tax=Streptomyces sp. NPDC057239 TaxID=3346061 RepID=UPI00363ABA08
MGRALRDIVRHCNATLSVLSACLADPWTRLLAARHPALSASALPELLAADDRGVVGAAVANPSLPATRMVSSAGGQ